ncbi:MAG: hypothetical protein N0E59_02195 [Candidatus Thiodiazotropha taylori]|nr:hypothetical protein [Candidatus Thiodiazotropha taylori]MCG8108689.1 hypothetical protein [Candidatus Thiodiazotropha taylori]MCG8109553.1 hypothetical protein [Candidatus Thiodiazotropha taylori]MCW4281025.1 hypothetical protein [Candidatus Thiodiazotropha taylori]MCW4281894.1 hypothetical protein [Candidatus Thiodiazotropha taylori]
MMFSWKYEAKLDPVSHDLNGRVTIPAQRDRFQNRSRYFYICLLVFATTVFDGVMTLWALIPLLAYVFATTYYHFSTVFEDAFDKVEMHLPHDPHGFLFLDGLQMLIVIGFTLVLWQQSGWELVWLLVYGLLFIHGSLMGGYYAMSDKREDLEWIKTHASADRRS